MARSVVAFTSVREALHRATVTTMDEPSTQPSGPDLSAFYDDASTVALICRVCGSLVAREGDYARAHWDWHEASNGA
jgi:hypothetical protein